MKDFLIDIISFLEKGTIAFPLLLLIAYRQFGIPYDYVLCFFCLCVFIFCLKEISIDKNGQLLISFSATYTIIYLANGYFQTIPHTIGLFCSFICFYMYGKYLVKRVPSERALLNLLLLITLLICIPFYIETIKDIRETSLINVTRAITLTEEEVSESNMINATIVGLTVSYGLAGMGTFLSFKNRMRSLYCWIFFAISIFSLLVNIHIINRTAIIVFVACVFGSILYLFRQHNRSVLIGFTILILLGVIFIPKLSNYEDVIYAYQERGITNDLSYGNRPALWGMSFSHLFTDLFGWRGKTPFAHNLWLDIARDCGIIPFLLFIIFTIRIIWAVVRISFIKNSSLICFLIGINIAVFLYGMVEPLYQANRFFFYICCLTWGLQSQLLTTTVSPMQK